MPSIWLISTSRFLIRTRQVPSEMSSPLRKSTLAPRQILYTTTFAGSVIRDSWRHREYRSSSDREVKSVLSSSFWSSVPVWKRAVINTLRCLVGCSFGDFSTMWFLQVNYPHLGVGTIMTSSIIAGMASSVSLETVFLRLGRDQLTWKVAAKTAVGMSFVSMLGMETVQNLVDYQLTGGLVRLHEAQFWTAAALSMLAGFLAPLPYNYIRLRKYGKACH